MAGLKLTWILLEGIGEVDLDWICYERSPVKGRYGREQKDWRL